MAHFYTNRCVRPVSAQVKPFHKVWNKAESRFWNLDNSTSVWCVQYGQFQFP